MPGLLRGMARTAVVAGTATAVSGRVQRRQNARWAQQEAPPQEYPPQQQYAAPPPAAPAAPAAEDRVQQLKDLAALKEQGVLTDEEFAIEKARILGG
jgi:hypothetical protein